MQYIDKEGEFSVGFEVDFLRYIIDNIQNPFLDRLMYIITSLGNAGIFWITLTLVFLLIKPLRREGTVMAAALVLTFVIVNLIIKPIADRARPFEISQYILENIHIALPTDASFPSGHTSASFAAAFAAFFVRKRTGALLIVIAFLIALSRIYFAVHFPTDVLAGAFIGIVMAYIAYRLYEVYTKK